MVHIVRCLYWTSRKPVAVSARLELAKLYAEANDIEKSKIEYQDILGIDPKNKEAKNALKKSTLR